MKNTTTTNVVAKPRKEWKEYGISCSDLWVNGQETKQQVIMRNGKFVTFASDLYRVLPNEDVLKIGDKVAKKAKASLYSPTRLNGRGSRNWYSDNTEYGKHVFTNNEGTQIVANYMFPDKLDVTGGKDFVQFGFMLRNGYDKKTAFSVSPMTVRMACDNIMYHVASTKLVQGLEERTGPYQGLTELERTEVLKRQDQKIKDARKSFNELGVRKLHFKTLTLDFVEETVENIRKGADGVLKRYQQMVDMKMSQRQAELIAKNMPKAVMKDIPYIHVNKNKLTGEVTYKLGERKNPESGKLEDATQWNTFNDITNSLTFAQKRSFNQNMGAYHVLDRVLVNTV
jgi:hypothetical protein